MLLGCLPPVGAEIFMPDGMGCIPPVVSPTLGGSKFEYTSGGSCGRACNIFYCHSDFFVKKFVYINYLLYLCTRKAISRTVGLIAK